MKNRKILNSFFVLAFIAVSIPAQTGGAFEITQSVIAGGGGQQSTGGQFSLDGRIGQAVAGNQLVGDPFTVTSGFWNFTPVISNAVTYEGDVQSRPNGDGFIDSDDIQQIRRFSVGLDLPYQSNEFQRADCSPRTTSGDGFVDSDDVQQARRYSVGLDSKQSSGGQTGSLLFEDWQETFKAKSTHSRTDSTNTATESITQSTESTAQRNSPDVEAGRAVRIVNQSTSPGQTITVPINVDTTGDETGYTFSIAFDQTKLSATAVTIGSLGGNVTSNINNTAGTIGFSITSFSGTMTSPGTIPAVTDQTLVTITFTVAANASQGISNITFTDNPARRKVSGIDPNTALPQPVFTDGTVTITAAPTAATVSVS